MNLKEGLDITRFNLKDYISEILVAILAFIFSSFISNIFNNLFISKHPDFFLFKEGYLSLGSTAIKILLWIFLFIIFNEFIRFFKRGVNYNFSIKDWPNKWIFHGLNNIQTNPSSLIVRHSDSGCLLKNYLWKNFEINFEIKYFPEVTVKYKENNGEIKNKHIDRSFGILFRANNLDSYYMVELHYKNETQKIWIKPHVRLNGHWEVLEDFELDRNIDISNYFNVQLKVENQEATLLINNNQVYDWILPTHIDRYGQIDDTSDNDKHKFNARTVPIVPFWNNYGMIGFRASWHQGASVRNLNISSLSKLDKIALFFKK